MRTRLEIAKNWLPRYTGMPIERFGDYVLLTNFGDYVTRFAERLRQIEALIRERNRSRPSPYEYLLPSRVPCSIAI